MFFHVMDFRLTIYCTRTGNIVAESFGTIILDENLKAPGNCELKLWDGLTCFD